MHLDPTILIPLTLMGVSALVGLVFKNSRQVTKVEMRVGEVEKDSENISNVIEKHTRASERFRNDISERITIVETHQVWIKEILQEISKDIKYVRDNGI